MGTFTEICVARSFLMKDFRVRTLLWVNQPLRRHVSDLLITKKLDQISSWKLNQGKF